MDVAECQSLRYGLSTALPGHDKCIKVGHVSHLASFAVHMLDLNISHISQRPDAT